MDYRLTYLLSIFKKAYEKNYNNFNPNNNNNNNNYNSSENGAAFSRLVQEAEKIFRNEKDLTDLDLDGAGGKTFLRVLLKLIMHDYPPLVSGSLQLLFRHFSQIQETLSAFKQVIFCQYFSNFQKNICLFIFIKFKKKKIKDSAACF